MRKLSRLLVAAAIMTLAAPSLAQTPDGAALFEANKCFACHGKDGRADTLLGKKEKVPDFTSAAFQQKVSDDQLREVITHGRQDTKMKAFGDKLSPGQVDALVKFVRGFGKQ